MIDLQSFSYRAGCWYLAGTAALYIVLTLIPEGIAARLAIGILGIASVLIVADIVQSKAESK
jgi:hypothetical protein